MPVDEGPKGRDPLREVEGRPCLDRDVDLPGSAERLGQVVRIRSNLKPSP